jgi:hypothetical protein
MGKEKGGITVSICIETDTWGTDTTIRMGDDETADQFIGRINEESEFIYKQIREYLESKTTNNEQ